MKLELELVGTTEPLAQGDPDIPGLILEIERTSWPEPPDQPLFVEAFQQTINSLPEQIALVDCHWTILAVNDAWTKTAAFYDYGQLVPGANYVAFCEARALEGHTPAAIAAKGIRDMERNGEPTFRFTYEGKDRWEGFAFHLRVSQIEVGGRTFYTVTRYDVSELVRLRQMREDFSHSLIEHQAEERRRMAREVHDSTMQLLASLGLTIGQLKRTRQPKASSSIVHEMEELLAEAQRELRAIAYLAHAPEVSELGLAKALRQLAGGFGRRTGLDIAMHADDPIALSPAAEVAVYRLAQEALSNVHRHAHATQVEIGLHQRRGALHVTIADNGLGMPERLRRGVGLSSMRSRIVELGGRMMIRCGHPGTILIATIPTHADMRSVGDLAPTAWAAG